ncbi:MAG: histidine kinase [Flavobacteriaceae bacterium]|nr:histidine kinase [Flavobacteriaceae bacterium]
METKKVFTIRNFKSGFILCLKISLILGIVFAILYRQYSVENFLLSLGISAMYTFGIGFGLNLLNAYLSSRWDWVKQTNARVAVGIIGTLVYIVPVVLGINYVLFVGIQDLDPSKFFSGNFFWIHIFYIILSLAVATFMHARDFMRNWKAALGKETKIQKVIAGTASAQFDALKNQLDPHFLFNSLNVLTSLIDEDPNNAQKFTTSLSKVYRYVLEQKNKDLVTVEDELNFARTYMSLLKNRFEDSIIFEIPDNVSNPDAKVVPLSLQLLLENAVKHNTVAANKPLHIKIYETENSLVVENNLQPKQVVKKSSGVGLANIVQRYALLTKREMTIEETSKKFRVSIPMLTKQVSTALEIQQDYIEDKRYFRAKERVKKVKEFYGNLTSYLIVIPVLAYINYQTTDFPWVIFPALGWGFGVLAHYLEATDRTPFLGRNWEERKINELMQEDEKEKKQMYS